MGTVPVEVAAVPCTHSADRHCTPWPDDAVHKQPHRVAEDSARLLAGGMDQRHHGQVVDGLRDRPAALLASVAVVAVDHVLPHRVHEVLHTDPDSTERALAESAYMVADGLGVPAGDCLPTGRPYPAEAQVVLTAVVDCPPTGSAAVPAGTDTCPAVVVVDVPVAPALHGPPESNSVVALVQDVKLVHPPTGSQNRHGVPYSGKATAPALAVEQTRPAAVAAAAADAAAAHMEKVDHNLQLQDGPLLVWYQEPTPLVHLAFAARKAALVGGQGVPVDPAYHRRPCNCRGTSRL
mmetsp:Transcript_16876/g.39242  ORF Transcript_16876/g.39242 Transcript_16876/m.39242 type:complete len:293 (+) Transcript_16876:1186-2064(+)